MMLVMMHARRWRQCTACGAIGRWTRDTCRRCATEVRLDNDFDQFVDEACGGGEVFSPLDQQLLCAHVQLVNDHHARQPLEIVALLPAIEPVVVVAEADACCCAVCLQPMGRGVPVTRACGHRLHRECLSQLLPGVVLGVRCPVCRTPLTRDDLPWDTSAHAVAQSARRVDLLLLLVRAHSAVDPADLAREVGLTERDVCVYHVCVMQVANALLDHRRLQWGFGRRAASHAEVQRRVARHVASLVRDNASLENTLHLVQHSD